MEPRPLRSFLSSDWDNYWSEEGVRRNAERLMVLNFLHFSARMKNEDNLSLPE